MKLKILLLLFLLPFGIFTSSNGAHLRDHILVAARIDGIQQVPQVTTNALGVASLMINGTRDTLCLTASFDGLSGPLTAAHIHEGLPGMNGGVLVDLSTGINGNMISFTLSGAALSSSLLSKILSGECYINLHTAANPNGEIRGQLLVEADKAFQFTMDGMQEVPVTITNAYGTGVFILSKDNSKIKYLVVMQGLSGALTGAHLHLGQPGIAGPVIVDLTSSIAGNIIAGVISNPAAALLDSMNAGSIYLNVHNAMFPSGEIRGQLMNSQQYLYFDAIINGAQQVPLVPTAAGGVAAIKMNTTLDSLWVDVVADGLTGPITSAHFHNGNPGVNGGVEIDLTNFINGNKIMGTVTGSALTTELINKFLKGEIYINLHTAAFPNGEIRGQVYRLLREGYNLMLSGDQEIPAVTTSASGAGIVSIDRDQDNAHFMIVASGIMANGAHFHNAVAGQSGGVIYDLTPYYMNNGIFGYWKSSDATPFTTAQSIRFRNDSVYVNLHTVANPGGEIRGQVMRGFNCSSLTTGIFTVTNNNVSTFTIFPNPAIDDLQIQFISAESGLKELFIYNTLGQKMEGYAFSVPAGQSVETVDVTTIPAGLYKVVIVDENGKTESRSFQKHTF